MANFSHPSFDTVNLYLEEVLGKDYRTRRKLVFTFSRDVTIRKSVNGRCKTANKFSLAISKLNLGGLGYSNYSNCSRCMSITFLPLEYLVSIEQEPDIDWKNESIKLAGRIHPNAWDDVRDKLLANESYLRAFEEISVTSICKKFSPNVLKSVKNAFENKTDFSYRLPGEKRDQTIECKLGDDGIFRAWYSSEYTGELNGAYWLLINPTTAAFREYD